MKVYVISLGFVSASACKMCFESVYKTKNPDVAWEHYFLYQHYPLKKEKNKKALKEICDDYGIHWLDAGENLGLSKGFNLALEKCGATDEDLVIGLDPDNIILSPGWDMALVRAIMGGKSIGWASLWNTQSPIEFAQKPHTEEVVDGYLKLWITQHPIVNSICIWRVKDLRDMGGLREVTPLYGGLEAEMFPHFKARGLRWAVLRQYEEGHPIKLKEDEIYREWKWKYAHTGEVKVDLETWIKNTSPHLT